MGRKLDDCKQGDGLRCPRGFGRLKWGEEAVEKERKINMEGDEPRIEGCARERERDLGLWFGISHVRERKRERGKVLNESGSVNIRDITHTSPQTI